MSTLAVDITNMKTYRAGRLILDIEKLLVGAGEHIAVVGPNGAGKSTLLQIINALLPYQNGEVRLFGEKQTPETAHRLRQMSSLIFQEPLLLGGTVYENIALPLKFRNFPAKKIKPLVEAVMNDFHCEHLASRYALSLSGGEAQRVCLARALVHSPRLLLLDEPFTALDAPTRTAILSDLKTVTKNADMTVLLISHNYQDILYFAERAIALSNGKIIQDNTPENLLRYPATKDVAYLAGMDNILPCQTERHGETVLIKLSDKLYFYQNKTLQASADTCCLPGDALTISIENNTHSSETNVVFKATVTHLMPGIGVYQITLLTDCGLSFVARIASRETFLNLKTGMSVQVSFDTLNAHLI
jgi:tungstate transport system ATP-binding protein